MSVAPLSTIPFTSHVIEHRPVSSTAHELTIERNGMQFEPGMLLTIHGSDRTHDREYSICSAPHHEHLQILYRYISSGRLTTYLRGLHAGDEIMVSGAHGSFVVRDRNAPIVFIGTGTGIAPCLSYMRSFPDLDLTVIHGVRDDEDLFYAEELERYPYFPCVTQSSNPELRRRVTDLLRSRQFAADSHYYLCGAYEMIYDVMELLIERGVDRTAIFQEPYYYQDGA